MYFDEDKAEWNNMAAFARQLMVFVAGFNLLSIFQVFCRNDDGKLRNTIIESGTSGMTKKT
jgi:hypothetical protein